MGKVEHLFAWAIYILFSIYHLFLPFAHFFSWFLSHFLIDILEACMCVCIYTYVILAFRDRSWKYFPKFISLSRNLILLKYNWHIKLQDIWSAHCGVLIYIYMWKDSAHLVSHSQEVFVNLNPVRLGSCPLFLEERNSNYFLL